MTAAPSVTAPPANPAIAAPTASDAPASPTAPPGVVVLPAGDLAGTLDWFLERGFRLLTISPADDPRLATIEGHGLHLQLDRDAEVPPGLLRLPVEPGPAPAGATVLDAPNGTRVEVVSAGTPLVVPELRPSFVISRADRHDHWITGRAGMRYRDLLPDRLGGRFIASHIAIPDGGPVPDLVHHHRVRFQLIFCHRGWVRVVYEDQGPPFLLEAGDCVLQPPGIRHRVLEASAGLHVVELSCPAEHETAIDHDLALPTATVRPERDFGGQRFVRARAADAAWEPWRGPGFEARDTGIAAATAGLAGVMVVRPTVGATAPTPDPVAHEGELRFLFILQGQVGLRIVGDAGAEDHLLAEADASAVPAGLAHALIDPSTDLELLEVTLPADLPLARSLERRA